ncbi:odorant receptor 83a isoform X1 [Bactrocera dorsalis]|uniref:Odorant receptor 83a isoform X1 n=1 Tax=Bactrocera dorsalis TaxID=27457 RepID=A0A6I9UZ10_BACDO|nr:odorant receptor 83a isoform X1 [Bactrocera dorsalis]
MKVFSEKVNKGTKIFAAGCTSAIVFQFFMPIIYRNRTLPLVCWYPVDYKTPFVYEIAYFFQTIALVQFSTLFMVGSAYFLSLCYLLSGQFDILYCSLKNIVATTYIYMGASKSELIELRDKERMPNEEINEYYVTDELPFDLDCLPHVLNPAETSRPRSFREAFNYALRPCVEHHIFILDVLRKLQRLFNFIWLVKTFVVTFFFCISAFNIVKLSEGKTFLKLFSIGHYLFLGLSELFMTCYASEIIYIGSQRCGEALLRSPWHLHLREIRADYLLFLTTTQHAFEFTAGKIYPLRLEKFRAIITTSFSVFTLLRNMDKGE